MYIMQYHRIENGTKKYPLSHFWSAWRDGIRHKHVFYRRRLTTIFDRYQYKWARKRNFIFIRHEYLDAISISIIIEILIGALSFASEVFGTDDGDGLPRTLRFRLDELWGIQNGRVGQMRSVSARGDTPW